MTVTKGHKCAACGKKITKENALQVDLWDDEEITTFVCSAACKERYEEGQVGVEAEEQPRHIKLAIIVLGLAVFAEVFRGLLSYLWSDPLAMVVPWPIHLLNGSILVALTFGIIRRRQSASKAALLISAVTATAHIAVAIGSRSAPPILLPISLTLPLFLLLLGNPGTTRQALALSFSIILPAYLLWSSGGNAWGHYKALRRIEEVSLPGEIVSSGAGGIKIHLPNRWHALRRENGIVDWPHSDIEIIHSSSGAAGFVVINPDCDEQALSNFQERSLTALAQAGGDPVLVGLVQLPNGAVELRVQTSRGSHQLESFDFFMELPAELEGGNERERTLESAGRRGCLWLHCLSPPRHRSQTRRDCRQMTETLEREAWELPL